MPRITSKRKQYKISDLSEYIVGKMYSQDIRQSALAEKLEISQPQLSYKLKNSSFTYGDLLTIFEFFGTNDGEILRLMKIGAKTK